MPSQPQTSRRAEVDGVISADSIYDTEAVMRHCGIGRVRLMELRQSGKLNAGKYGGDGRLWYRGSELIALIFSEQQQQKQRKVG